MKIKIVRKGENESQIRDVAAVPRRGDVLSLPNADRTVAAVDWQVGEDREFAATVWID